jgi:hypothetical protein
LQFEQLNDDTYIQRRNIQKAPDREGVEDSGYECESRMISKDVYNDMLDALSDPSQTELLNKFNIVTENQESSDDNTLIIMDAIADLYELISTITS